MKLAGKVAVIGVVILLAGVLPMFSDKANAIEINPLLLEVTGKKGDFVTKTIEIYNDRDEEVIVNVTVIGITDYYIPKSVYKLKPYERRTIPIGFIVNRKATGMITYDVGDYAVIQIVRVDIEKIKPTIVIFPQEPKPGGTIMITLISDTTLGRVNGTMFCSGSGNLYQITINQNIGYIKLSPNDYGQAFIYLYGDEIEPTYYYFNISGEPVQENESEEEANLELICPSNAKIGNVTLSLVFNGDGVRGKITLINPDGLRFVDYTNSNGVLSFYFDVAGIWSITGEYEDYVASKQIRIIKREATISIPKIYTGKDVTIETIANANYEIVSESGEKMTGFTEDGKISVRFSEPGKYTITVYNDKYESSKTFDVYSESKLMLLSDNYMSIFGSYRLGKTVYIKVLDKNTNKPLDVTEVIVMDDRGSQVSLTPSNGVATWIPPKSGTYTIVVPDRENIIGSSATITIYSPSGGINKGLIVIIALICVFGVAVYYHRNKGIRKILSFLKTHVRREQ